VIYRVPFLFGTIENKLVRAKTLFFTTDY